MKVTLKEIDRENFRAAVKLEVNEDQKDFVAPNVYSIAQSKVEPTYNVRAVYDGDEMVGFVMYGWDDEDGCHVLGRLMIDRGHQGKGYGRAATEAVIERLRAEPGCKQVLLSVNPANANARALYESLGFVRTGEVSHGEEVMRLRFED